MRSENDESLFRLLGKDLSRFDHSCLLNGIKQYIIPKGRTFPYVFWLRVVQCSRHKWYTRWTVGVVAYIILRHMEFKYGIHINPNIHIGGGLYVVHGGSVHLNCLSIGENFTVFHGVTLGTLNGQKPTVGNNVTVYTNSVVVGGITLHDNAIVGALSYVSHDVPKDTVVAGAPAKAILGTRKKTHD